MSPLSHLVIGRVPHGRFAPPVQPAASAIAETGADNTEIRSILVPLDGTRHAEHALPHALAIARRNRAVLRIAQAYSYREEAASQDGVWSEDDPAGAIREPHEHYLQSVVQRISRVHQVPVIASLLESDAPGRQLKELQAQTDLTVLTSRRRGWLSRLCRESMVDLLLDRAERPVLLIRGYDAPADLTGHPLCRHVVLPLEDPQSVPRLIGHVQLLGGREPQLISLWPISEEAAFAANAWLSRSPEATGAELPSARTTVVIASRGHGGPSTLANITGESDVDLIAVARPTGAREFSWAETSPSVEIARNAQVPVLVLPSPPQVSDHPAPRGRIEPNLLASPEGRK
ncbi:universal stress protein [Planctomyces sp. SH-PL14]|uniref:universal stress protein n=1 Tax=Planctomyces sp. SH-PL14 TaxID=1632864 RepID=UPI00078BBAF7|nr:universal stress protein [Planctomyces sp. SH-PL14]AMV16981.1 Universal stress protein family protein [Planctomyces sp. SH-PL14]